MHQHTEIEDSCLSAGNKELANKLIDQAYWLGYDDGYSFGLATADGCYDECCERSQHIDDVVENIRNLLLNFVDDVIVHRDAKSGEYIVTSAQVI